MPTTSYQLPLVGSSSRPSPPYTPPIIRTGASGGLFQKRNGQRVPHSTAVRGISRVQSMPAHNSHHYVDDVSFFCSYEHFGVEELWDEFPAYFQQIVWL